MLVGMSGFNTCDMEVDGNGNAVDCSSWWNFFNLTCWNPLSPCAATGAVDGQPTTVDNSKSQLGTFGAMVLEGNPSGTGGGGFEFLGLSPMVWILGITAILLIRR